jgi:uncharacterized protein DUF6049
MCAMARSHATKRRNRRISSLGRVCLATGLGLAVLALPMLAGSALAQSKRPVLSLAAKVSVHRDGTSAPPLSLTVTSASPGYASPGHAITIRGRVRNNTGSVMTDLSVRMLFSADKLATSTALQQFAAGTQVLQSPLSMSPVPIARLKAHHSVAWHLRLPVSELHLDCFGVYPLTAEVSDQAAALSASDPLPLPFWPGKASSCPQSARPAPYPISWIWPLIDSPHQGPCPGLLDNTLAASLGTDGRLASLLAVGGSYAAKARLTWAIDPALLDNAQTMTKPYSVGDSANCTDGRLHAADPQAKAWLASVVKATTGRSVFVTPYADVDVAGLAQYSQNAAALRQAFTIGQQIAGPMLGRSPVPAKLPAGPKQLSAIAWPANGLASSAVLENLGAMHVSTVILAMPPYQTYYTPGAVTSVNDGVGTRLKALLADGALSDLLASTAVSSPRAGSIFNLSQRFLAQTAMIAAEAPAMRRPVLVTPPRRWDPTTKLATDLLKNTVTAPWLQPSTVGQLAAAPATKIYAHLLQPHASSELPGGLLRKVTKLDRRANLLSSIMLGKDSQLARAVYGIESSAWLGKNAPVARAMLERTDSFVYQQFAGLSVGGRQTIHVVLGGRVGSVTISIHNSLGYPVRVGVRVASSNNTVSATQKNPHEVYVVTAHSASEVKLSVSATQTGKATLTLRLRAPSGALLPDPPDKPLTMEISATNLGTVALIICAAALAVFVIASATQAIRRGRPKAPPADEPIDPAPSAGPPDGEPSASVPGPEDGGRANNRAQPDKTDNVVPDRSELHAVAPAISDQELIAPGHRPTEESR